MLSNKVAKIQKRKLYKENYKFLLKDIKQELNKREEDTACSRIEGLKITKYQFFHN